MSRLKIPAYQPDLFCNRLIVKEIEEIVEKIESGNPHCPIVIQAGRGSGKTWLCLHLQRSILEAKEKTTPLLIGLEQPPDITAGKNEWFLSPEKARELSENEDKAELVEALLSDLLGKFAKDLGAWVGECPTLGELSAWVINVLQRAPNKTWVILLDSAFESDWALLDGLEKRLLAPLVTLPNVLILITGRGKLYPWQSPYLRTQVKTLELGPLSEDEARQQIENFSKKEGKEKIQIVKANVFEKSKGHPLANILLAQGASIEEVIQELLTIIPEGERQQIREFLEALCPLDRFVEGHLKPMLKAYYGERSEKAQHYDSMSRSDLRQKVLDRLIANSLVRWQEGGYQIDEHLHSYLRQNLEGMPIYQNLRTAASKLYEDWAKQFPKGSQDAEYYQKQAEKFQAREQ